jgi:elongation factor 3
LPRRFGKNCPQLTHTRTHAPPRYTDTQEALGALAAAIKAFDGGVLLISHNSEFTSTCCNETWRVEGGVVKKSNETPPGPSH